MIMISSNFIFSFTGFLRSVLLTMLLALGVLFSTGVTAVEVGKLVIVILFLTSFS